MSEDINDVTQLHTDEHEEKVAFLTVEAAEREKKWLEDLVVDGEDALRAAIYSGHVRDVEFSIERGVSADSAIWIACDNCESEDAQEGILDVLKALIRLGNVDARDDINETALMATARRDNVSFAKELIRHGADVNAKDDNGQTPLMHAAKSDAANVAAKLLRHGANVNAKDISGKTALMYAAEIGSVDVAIQLIQHGADVNAKDDNGKIALMYASSLMNVKGNRSNKVASVLLRHNSSNHPSPSDDEADLCIAAVWGDVVSLRALVERGVGLEFASHHGKTALYFAVEYKRTDAALLLIASGACADVKVHPSPHWECATPLLIAGRTEQMQVFKALMQARAPVNVCSSVDGETPLISAARFGDFSAVPLLVLHGGSALRVEDVGDDEYPLLPGSLETMTTMCTTLAFEFEPMCTRMIARLQIVCCELQHQPFVQQPPTDLTAVEPTAASAAPHHSDVLVAFARIVYRACRLLFDIKGKNSALSRFIASREIVRRIKDIDVELDNFARMQRFEARKTYVLSMSGRQSSGSELESLTQQLQQGFEQALGSNNALTCSFFEDRFETAVLLKYELSLLQREQYQETRLVFVEQVLTRYLRVCGIKKAPDVPDWFISRDDLEFSKWNSVKADKYGSRYEGTWRGTKVTIDFIYNDHYLRAENKWHSLKHPNIVEFFGACRIGSSKLLVYKSTQDGLPLYEFLRKSESNRARTWQCLYEAALGLQYMHSRGITHDRLQSESIIVGSDMVARLNDIGGSCNIFYGKTRNYISFGAPEHKYDPRYDSTLQTMTADIYSFGLCVLEALSLEDPWKRQAENSVDETPESGYQQYQPADDDDIDWTVIERCEDSDGDETSDDDDVDEIAESGNLPDRPAALDDAEWSLINDMCAKDPSERVDIAHVVKRLKQFKQEHEQTRNSSTIGDSTDETSSSVDSHSKSQQRIDEHCFVDLDSMTISTMLELVTLRCEKLDDAKWILVNVLPALEFVFDLLQQRESAVADADVVGFCTVLGRLWRYVRTATSDNSVYQRMRSRKVAASHRLVYVELDQLLDSLQVPTDDPIRSWRLELASSIISAASPNGPAATANEVDSTPITLNHLDTPLATYKQWTQAGLKEAATLEAPDWRPAWYLPLRDLEFSKADKLGQGAFGAVYKGRWRDALVVIKFMGYEEDIKTIETDMLLHEVRVWHRLNHPHVLKFYGASHVDKRFFVCELAGDELSKYLEQPDNGHLVWQKLHEAALGLKYLHDSGVVHNDLKGDNIMVARDGKAKLIDFGMSALLGEAEIMVDIKKIGAVNWRSPEYLTGGRPSHASDVYSFAMCIIEAVSGDSPWGKKKSVAIKPKVRKGIAPPLPASMTLKQRNLIERMTTLEPAARVSMAIVVNTLREIALDERAMHAP